MTHFMFLSPLK